MNRIASLALLVLTVAAAGCDSDKSTNPPDDNNNPTSTTYVGVFVGAAENGSISVSVPNANAARPLSGATGDPVTVTGSIKIAGGSTITLSGTLITSTGLFSVAGGGYTFSGSLEDETISGSYTGPNGTGGFTAESSASGATKVFLGTYHETDGDEQGTFNMIIKGTEVTVLAVQTGETEALYLTGTLNGNTITLHLPDFPEIGVATGTLSGNTVSGQYQSDSSEGTWSGTQVQ